MRRHHNARKKRFRAALALAGKSGSQFATELGVSSTHVYLVLVGQRESPRIDAAIDALIAKYSIPAA